MNNTKKWNAILRMVGFIVIVAMIGFSMAGCEEDSGGGGGIGKQLVGTWTNDEDEKFSLEIKTFSEQNGQPVYDYLAFSLHEEGYSGYSGTERAMFQVNVKGNTLEAQSSFSDTVPTITHKSNGKITISGMEEYWSDNDWAQNFNGTYTKQAE